MAAMAKSSSPLAYRVLRGLAFVVIGFVVLIFGLGWLAFGRGRPYPDLTGPPELDSSALEVAVRSERPIGNAAVSADGRVFYTIHPESKPRGPKLYVAEGGQSEPYPNESLQEEVFVSPLGVAIDPLNRLWVVDPANHGFGGPRLLAFDLATDEVVHEFRFPRAVAPWASFLQDLQVSSDGRWVYIADVGFWLKRPAIIVYDTEQRVARRLLQRHQSVYPENYLIRTAIKEMSFFGGLLEMKTGVDGIALSRDDRWLYYGAMNHESMFRIRTRDLRDTTIIEEMLVERIETVGRKPLNDGLSIDDVGNVFITDVEHGAVVAMNPEGDLRTIVKDDRIRWADGLSFGPDGWLYLADSAIPHLALQNQEQIAAQAPYYVWRFKPGTTGPAGQ